MCFLIKINWSFNWFKSIKSKNVQLSLTLRSIQKGHQISQANEEDEKVVNFLTMLN